MKRKKSDAHVLEILLILIIFAAVSLMNAVSRPDISAYLRQEAVAAAQVVQER